MKKSAAIIVALVGIIAVTVAAPKEAKQKTIRQQIAEKEPAFQAEWLRVGKTGTLSEFLKLKESKTAKSLVSLSPVRSILDTCVNVGMSPWITVAEVDAKDVQAVPLGWVLVPMSFEFDVPGFEQTVKWEVSALKIAPELPAFPGEGYNASIMRGFKGPKKTPVSGAQLHRALWVSIPKDTTSDEMELTVSAVATGPKDGVVKTATEQSKVKVHILRDAKPTRENLFCLWQRGVDAGEWVTNFPAGDAELKNENQHLVEWVHGWFKQFAANPQLADAALVKELMANDRYVKFVIPNAAAGHDRK